MGGGWGGVGGGVGGGWGGGGGGVGGGGGGVEPPGQLLSLDGVCPNVLTLPTSLPAWQESP